MVDNNQFFLMFSTFLITCANLGYIVLEFPKRMVLIINNVTIETFFNLQNPLYFSDTNVLSFLLEIFIIAVVGVDLSNLNDILLNQVPLW